jgi:hypothetical protein
MLAVAVGIVLEVLRETAVEKFTTLQVVLE